jgi:cellobiose PTS system EIIB component
MTQYSIQEMQNNPDEVLQTVEREKTVEITRQGRQVAVLLSVDEYHRLAGTESSKFGAALKQFRQEFLEDGLDLDPDEVFKDVRDRSPGREVIL